MRENLKPCPFCDASLEKQRTDFTHPRGKCILSGHVFKGGFIGQWNRRSSDAEVVARAARVKQGIALALHAARNADIVLPLAPGVPGGAEKARRAIEDAILSLLKEEGE